MRAQPIICVLKAKVSEVRWVLAQAAGIWATTREEQIPCVSWEKSFVISTELFWPFGGESWTNLSRFDEAHKL